MNTNPLDDLDDQAFANAGDARTFRPPTGMTATNGNPRYWFAESTNRAYQGRTFWRPALMERDIVTALDIQFMTRDACVLWMQDVLGTARVEDL